MSFHGGFLGVLAAMSFVARGTGAPGSTSLTSSHRWCRSVSPPEGWATSSTANCGAASPTRPCPGRWFFRRDNLPRHPSQLYQAAGEG